MTMKSQLRAAKNPATFIQCVMAAGKNADPHDIVPDHFGQMTAMIFEEVYSDSFKHFNAMHGFAHSPRQGGRLIEPFYRAAQSGFGQVTVCPRVRRQHWPEFFSGVAPTIRNDKKLTAIVNRETVVKALPALVWALNPNDETTEAATGIIAALGDIPEAISALDPALVTSLVRQHIEREGNPITVAPKLMELRESDLFRTAIVEHENEAGVHVGAIEKKTGPYETHMFSLEFNRVGDTVQVYELRWRGRNWVSEVILDSESGTCTRHNEAVADALFEYSTKPHKGQEWVKPIAERVAFEII